MFCNEIENKYFLNKVFTYLLITINANCPSLLCTVFYYTDTVVCKQQRSNVIKTFLVWNFVTSKYTVQCTHCIQYTVDDLNSWIFKTKPFSNRTYKQYQHICTRYIGSYTQAHAWPELRMWIMGIYDHF